MRQAAVMPLLLALAMAATPRPAAAATLSASAGIKITFETPDDSNPVQIYVRQTTVGIDDTDGDGVTTGGSTLIEDSLTSAPVFTTSYRVTAESQATVTGEASFRVDLVQRFTVTRSLDADREVTITLSQLDGLLLQAFAAAGSAGDIGSASAIVTLERTGFEGTLFAQSVSQTSSASLRATSRTIRWGSPR